MKKKRFETEMFFSDFLKIIRGMYGENSFYIRKNKQNAFLIYAKLKTQTEDGRTDFFIKLKGKIEFTNVHFSHGDDGYRDYEVYEIIQKDSCSYSVTFDVGDAVLLADEVSVVFYSYEDFSSVENKLCENRNALLLDDDNL